MKFSIKEIDREKYRIFLNTGEETTFNDVLDFIKTMGIEHYKYITPWIGTYNTLSDTYKFPKIDFYLQIRFSVIKEENVKNFNELCGKIKQLTCGKRKYEILDKRDQ